VGYVDFCRLDQKGAVVTLVISGVNGSILTKLAHDIATILRLNIFESCRFGTPACQIKVILPILSKIRCHGNVP